MNIIIDINTGRRGVKFVVNVWLNSLAQTDFVERDLTKRHVCSRSCI